MENQDQRQKLCKEMAKMDGKNENRKLMENKLNVSGKKPPNSPILRRGLPAELLNELFGSLPVGNAYGLLAKMPNSLLARNAQKMINGIEEAIKNNKLNENDCGSGLAISDEGLTAKHYGTLKYNCIRAVLPISTMNLKINKPRIAFYFEVQILTTTNGSINIGFCDRLFPLEGKWFGAVDNSIGFWNKRGIYIDRVYTEFENSKGVFEKGNFIGLGIVQQPNSKLECFATWNGKLLGEKAELVPRIADFPLPSNDLLSELTRNANFQFFPAIDLYSTGDSVRVNFGKEEWQFKEFQSILK